MTEYIRNQNTNSWVILSPRRAKRPEDKKDKKKTFTCPFCYGNEALTPPEVLRVGGGTENKEGWSIRVVPNKYKITDIHEVIVHTPNHNLEYGDLSNNQVLEIFKVYRERYNVYRDAGQVVIFKNTGKEAAESLTHDHSQLTVVPFDVKFSQQRFSKDGISNIAYENEDVVIFCPSDSQWPYETVVMLKKSKNNYFGDSSDRELEVISSFLKRVIVGLKKEISDFSYNYYISSGSDWYVRLIPRVTQRGGFELATGIMVNIKNPLDVMDLLKATIG